MGTLSRIERTRSICGAFRYLAPLAIACIILLCLAIDGAPNLENLNIQKAFESADAVLVAEIVAEEKLYEGDSQCGTRYLGRVQRKFKEHFAATGDEITFGRYPQYARGTSYLLFLKYQSDPLVAYESRNASASIGDYERKYIDFIRCGGIVPGFVADVRMVWHVLRGHVVVGGRVPDDLPKSARVYSDKAAAESLIRTEDLFSYLEMLGRATR
jgi:hypothetical protein